ncbi:MAG: hypothetical protein AAB904_00375 [Patescibacteria group bacterium]
MAFEFFRDEATGRPMVRDVVKKGQKAPASTPASSRSSGTSEGAASPLSPRAFEKPSPGIPIRVIKKAEPKSAPEPLFRQREIVAAKSSHSGSYTGFFWFFGALAAVAAAFFLLNVFGYVDVVITPKTQKVEVSLPIRASAAGGRDVGLEIIRAEERMMVTEPITQTRTLEQKATGQVVIYNAYSRAPQVLVQGTRLEAPGGRIYRTGQAVTVPGAKMEGTKIIPQGVEVSVSADKPGKEYNLGLSDFTIPGFKGTPQYQKFYARSKTEMKGGIAGTFTAVTEEDVDRAIYKAKTPLADALKKKIESDLPAGVFLPQNSSRITYTASRVEPPLLSEAREAAVEVLAVFEGLGLNQKDLEETIASSYLSLSPDEPVAISNLSELMFEKVHEDFTSKVANFRVTGAAHFVWQFDEAALKDDLIASEDRALVFEKYPAVERAEVRFKPAWWRIFPKDPDRVKIRRITAEG